MRARCKNSPLRKQPIPVEYVIPGDWLGGADAARMLGNPAVDFLGGWRETGGTYQGVPIPNGSPVSSSKRGGDSRSGRSGYGSHRRDRSSGIVALSAHRSVRVTYSGLVGAGGRIDDYSTGQARRRNLEGPGTSDPRHPALRRLARSPDQRARPIVRCGLACAIERAHTESGAATGRELLRNYAGGLGRIETRARLQSHREVFGRYSQPYARR
jgi:hypothetical protein